MKHFTVMQFDGEIQHEEVDESYIELVALQAFNEGYAKCRNTARAKRIKILEHKHYSLSDRDEIAKGWHISEDGEEEDISCMAYLQVPEFDEEGKDVTARYDWLIASFKRPK